ncbi:Ig-like domain-containing protein [Longimicrobium terrae]|uniref:Uncharacterized protein YjdB n=1 Tax=Longimicrobium terrae TaxID=1639882 RepID=A0A841H2Q7_9BACT|nr:uncharacterized protein YjdB [Longimicrobium terrae]MBB6072139.1 uncharacterized protein YjdB [Longimicrobium terrae]NNC29779.1 hypothetical protein [Longimicrobium terrae]
MIGLAACGDNPAGSGGGNGGNGGGQPQPAPVSTVTVDPQQVTLEIGMHRLIGARTLAADGAELTGRAVTWSSSNPAVAEVSAAGQVTARATGIAMIRAAAEGRFAETRVEVPAPVSRVQVLPGTLALRVGENGVLQASAFGPGGAPVTGLPVQWTSLNPATATVAADGRVTALDAGEARIRATVLGVSAEALVQVSPPPPPLVHHVSVTPTMVQLKVGESWSFTAQPLSAANQPVEAPAAAWSSSNPAVATVTADGRVQARAVGTAMIRATIAGVTGEGSVTVAAEPPPPPDPVVYDLVTMDGQSLPAALYTRSLPGGVTGTVRIQGGYFKPDAFDAAGRAHYELALFSSTFLPDGSLRDSETYFDEGTAERQSDGSVLLRSSMHAGFTFTARGGGVGTIIVRQTLGGEGPVREYLFRAD